MTTYNRLNENGSDIRTSRSFLNQLIDVQQNDISGSVSRRKYQVFVTGGVGPGVTSSLFQTVYDQDFTLQSANPVFDITVGLAPPDVLSSGIADTAKTSKDSNEKYLYPSSSLMMREKTDIYGQFAQILLGNRSTTFKLPTDAQNINATANYDSIDAALFISFKRLFSRDQIKKETFAMRFYQTASFVRKNASAGDSIDMPPSADANGVPNIEGYYVSGSSIYTDVGAGGEANRYFEQGGQYGYLVNASSPSNAVGIMFYDAGTAVFDIEKITSGSQFISGTISAMRAPNGLTVLGGAGTQTEKTAKLVPDLLVSGSIDNILDHFCSTRFRGDELTAMTFQNVTNINSSLIFCRVRPEFCNYSSNPTYRDSTTGDLSINDPRIAASDQEVFSYITTIGLYDNNDGLVAVAKLSRPVEKNPGRDLTFRVRLDF